MPGHRSVETISPFVVGDPIVVNAPVCSLADLKQTLGFEPTTTVGSLLVAPRVALLHAIGGSAPGIVVRWCRLESGAALDALGPVDAAIALFAPIGASGRALRLVSRLRACLSDPTLVARWRSARTREELVSAIAPIEERGGESPLDASETLALLRSSPAGLSTAEADRRRAEVGPNRLERVRRRPMAARLLEQFWSFFAVLLWIGAACAFIARMPELGWAIVVVILVNGVFSFFQEYRAERAVEALEELMPQEITVLRDGPEARQSVEAIVPGDVVRIDEGDRIPADGQIVSAAGLRVDQAALTGESHPVFKLPSTGNAREHVPLVERHEMVFAGTSVVAGSGVLVVRATGMATEIGTIARLTQTVPVPPSPLQREMARVTRIVTALAVAFGLVFFALGVATGAFPLAQGLVFALGVIVANVPEGLLPTLTLALALGVQRLARGRSVVKRLSAVEALGATTVICTDKTGTLTENRMAARFVWLGGRTCAIESVDRDLGAEARDLFEAAALASQATAEHGDPTEIALVACAEARGVDVAGLRRAQPILSAHPFDSFRKRMTLVRAQHSGATALVKGAPVETIALCERIRVGSSTVALGSEMRLAIVAEHDRLASDGLRLIAVATRPVAESEVEAGVTTIERGLTFLGLVALWDPPRPEVAEAVALCRRAGIRVILVTGDYGLTARAIASQIGIAVRKVVTGDEVDRLPPRALREILAEEGVLFARTTPAHKLAIVTELRALGEVVAVTGDGVNDAPALKAADIGIAMGRRGSNVAKEAAVMVITDDNFASIVTAIRGGRAIYANMGKFVTYIFASNVPELVPFLAFVFLHVPLPLTIMQILAVDLGTDLLPALALATEAPEPDVMDRPPRAARERLLSAKRLLRAYAFLGVAEAALSLLAFFWTYWLAGWRPGLPFPSATDTDLYRRATTMTLAGVVAAQVGNVFACRTDRESVFRVGVFRNRMVLFGIVAEVAILCALVAVPPLRVVFGLAPLRFEEWSLLLAFPPLMVFLEETRKGFVRRR
ncbi:MAG: HAD-IC family P-type ATPase [Planctomycetes bacterium]|nr:HAD-IC family P-type ATPase [Planctomycetota bacterium]MBI3848455.1 HAD-IC family P-type ATPase [Planctomycetota bacterium]